MKWKTHAPHLKVEVDKCMFMDTFVAFHQTSFKYVAFVVRYLTKRFIGEYDANKEMLYTHKTTYEGNELNIDILDTANDGGEELLSTHVTWADGIVLLYSVTDRSSLSRLDYLHSFIAHARRHSDGIPLMMVGNKTDQAFARQIPSSETSTLSKKYECSCQEISIAESKDGVLGVMEGLFKLIKKELSQDGFGRKSTFNNVRRVFKKKVTRSRSDSFFR
ncbi:hypothetical protein CAPTEDRAFT_215951 [Capitella teleta]|uniref:small monomeric GTPase n=1 Tax=Capitella teleta TaxID=283909 RepID=R7VHC9_CAPTE|nr:hypothetical protein CAPTEDRAFT_215951 [Capitella teleta]|eukprot:ELU15105.1 hypothetical protein CAPTEDRAFT_215951 [Capitella teleta]